MSLQARYTILRKIADGGTAEIFLANQRGVHGFEKLVVLKRIFPAYYADPQFRNMLVNEAHIAMSLNHSNIVQVLDLGEDEGQYILALELVDGWTLDAVIRRVRAARSTMPPALALSVTAEVCRALAYAHAKTNAEGKPLGIVHRDISPHNVLLSEQGEVKLTDFGIATAENQREQGADKIIRGKIAYMSPEQAAGEPMDARSDLFSVGTMLYVMVCGRYPFDAATDLELLLLVKSGHFVPPESARPGVHPELARLLRRLMTKDVAARYQSADEVLADVEQIMRTAFRSVGQTELKRWLQDLSIRDGVAALTKASPAVATAQAGRVLGPGSSSGSGPRDAAAPAATAASAGTAPHRAPPPVPPAARAVSPGVRPPPPKAALSVGRRPATSITLVAGQTGVLASPHGREPAPSPAPLTTARAEPDRAASVTAQAPATADADEDTSQDVEAAEIWTPEPDEELTPTTMTAASLPAATPGTSPSADASAAAAAVAEPVSPVSPVSPDRRDLGPEVPSQGERERPAPRLTPGPSRPSLIALSSTATVPPPSKIVPAPPTGNSGLHAIPPPPVSSAILAALGSGPLAAGTRGAAGSANPAPSTSTAFPGSINTLPLPARSRRGAVIGAGLAGVVALVISIKTCSSGRKERATVATAPAVVAVAPSDAGGGAAASQPPEPTKPAVVPVVAPVAVAVDAVPPPVDRSIDARGSGVAATDDAASRPSDLEKASKADTAGPPVAEDPAPAAATGAVVPAIDGGQSGSVKAAAEPTSVARADIPAAPPRQAMPPRAMPDEAPRRATSEAPAPAAPPTTDPPAPGGSGARDVPAGEVTDEEDKGQKVMLLVKSVPSGARLTTAHHDYGTTPVSIRLRSGNTYAFILTLSGFRPTKQRVEVTTDPEQEVTVTLKKPSGATASTPAPAPPPPPGPAAAPAPPPPKAPEGASWWQKMFKKR